MMSERVGPMKKRRRGSPTFCPCGRRDGQAVRAARGGLPTLIEVTDCRSWQAAQADKQTGMTCAGIAHRRLTRPAGRGSVLSSARSRSASRIGRGKSAGPLRALLWLV